MKIKVSKSGDLKDAFIESDLPFKVDVADWAAASENFKKIIKTDRSLVQKKRSVRS